MPKWIQHESHNCIPPWIWVFFTGIFRFNTSHDWKQTLLIWSGRGAVRSQTGVLQHLVGSSDLSGEGLTGNNGARSFNTTTTKQTRHHGHQRRQKQCRLTLLLVNFSGPSISVFLFQPKFSAVLFLQSATTHIFATKRNFSSYFPLKLHISPTFFNVFETI